MSNDVWVVADLKLDGTIRKVTFEALSEAKSKLTCFAIITRAACSFVQKRSVMIRLTHT